MVKEFDVVIRIFTLVKVGGDPMLVGKWWCSPSKEVEMGVPPKIG